MKKILGKLKKIKLNNILGIFIFLICIIPAFIFNTYLKLRKKELWVICESGELARDNGFAFYKFMKKKHPEVKTYFAIKKNSSDYDKVAKYGNVVLWESLKHYFLYMSATNNISSHKSGEPNHPLFYVLHNKLKLYNKFVFLQHGVLYQNHEMFHKKNCSFKLFICGAKGEYDFVCDKFGYGYNSEVRYTGLARFDDLYDAIPEKKIIAYIPTWRRWLDSREKFEESEYFNRIQSLINNKELEKILEENDKYLYFYPHTSSQKYIDLYVTNNKRIKIISAKDIEIQELLKKAILLVTDFSSVFTDFAYMEKTIIYYQYDYKDFMEKHIGNSCYDTYFDFEKDGFGKVTGDEKELVDTIKSYIDSDFKLKQKYQERINKFFVLHDRNNCERIYEEIMRG